MRTWNVQGVNVSGEPAAVSVNAESKEEAARQAKARGVHPVSVEGQEPLNYAQRQTDDRPKPPFYAGLLITRVGLYLMAVLSAAVGVLRMIGSPPSDEMPVLWAVAGLSSAVLLAGAGSACGALRDMARNSFGRNSSN